MESASSPEAQAESQKVLAEVRASKPLLTKEQEQAAMERLLNKGTRSVSFPLICAHIVQPVMHQMLCDSGVLGEAMQGIA